MISKLITSVVHVKNEEHNLSECLRNAKLSECVANVCLSRDDGR